MKNDYGNMGPNKLGTNHQKKNTVSISGCQGKCLPISVQVPNLISPQNNGNPNTLRSHVNNMSLEPKQTQTTNYGQFGGINSGQKYLVLNQFRQIMNSPEEDERSESLLQKALQSSLQPSSSPKNIFSGTSKLNNPDLYKSLNKESLQSRGSSVPTGTLIPSSALKSDSKIPSPKKIGVGSDMKMYSKVKTKNSQVNTASSQNEPIAKELQDLMDQFQKQQIHYQSNKLRNSEDKFDKGRYIEELRQSIQQKSKEKLNKDRANQQQMMIQIQQLLNSASLQSQSQNQYLQYFTQGSKNIPTAPNAPSATSIPQSKLSTHIKTRNDESLSRNQIIKLDQAKSFTNPQIANAITDAIVSQQQDPAQTIRKSAMGFDELKRQEFAQTQALNQIMNQHSGEQRMNPHQYKGPPTGSKPNNEEVPEADERVYLLKSVMGRRSSMGKEVIIKKRNKSKDENQSKAVNRESCEYEEVVQVGDHKTLMEGGQVVVNKRYASQGNGPPQVVSVVQSQAKQRPVLRLVQSKNKIDDKEGIPKIVSGDTPVHNYKHQAAKLNKNKSSNDHSQSMHRSTSDCCVSSNNATQKSIQMVVAEHQAQKMKQINMALQNKGAQKQPNPDSFVKMSRKNFELYAKQLLNKNELTKLFKQFQHSAIDQGALSDNQKALETISNRIRNIIHSNQDSITVQQQQEILREMNQLDQSPLKVYEKKVLNKFHQQQQLNQIPQQYFHVSPQLQMDQSILRGQKITPKFPQIDPSQLYNQKQQTFNELFSSPRGVETFHERKKSKGQLINPCQMGIPGNINENLPKLPNYQAKESIRAILDPNHPNHAKNPLKNLNLMSSLSGGGKQINSNNISQLSNNTSNIYPVHYGQHYDREEFVNPKQQNLRDYERSHTVEKDAKPGSRGRHVSDFTPILQNQREKRDSMDKKVYMRLEDSTQVLKQQKKASVASQERQFQLEKKGSTLSSPQKRRTETVLPTGETLATIGTIVLQPPQPEPQPKIKILNEWDDSIYSKHKINRTIQKINKFIQMVFKHTISEDKFNVEEFYQLSRELGVKLPKRQDFNWQQIKISREFHINSKIRLLNYLYQAFVEQNGSFDVVQKSSYKAFVGKGNNSQIVRSILKERYWWGFTDEWENANFIWTQNRVNRIIASFPSQLEVTNTSMVEMTRKYTKKHKNKPTRKVIYNRIEDNFHLSNKKALFYNMSSYYKFFSRDPFDVLPLTFHIRKGQRDPQWNEFLQRHQEIEAQKSENADVRNIWIVKPGENTNCGNGINVCASLEDVKSYVSKDGEGSRTYIIQKYIERPLLVNKRKFDIRVFAVHQTVNGCKKAYFFQDGYLRTSCKEYNLNNMNRFIHLTNDAIQKRHEDYGKYENGNKLSLSDFQKYCTQNFSELNVDVWRDIMPQVKSIMRDTFRATYQKLDPYTRQHPTFEIFGFDFMLDADFKIYLIEVNTNPCLDTPCPLLTRIISSVLDNSLRITLDPYLQCQDLNVFKKNNQGDILPEIKFELIFDDKIDGPQLQEYLDSLKVKEKEFTVEEVEEEADEEPGQEVLENQDTTPQDKGHVDEEEEEAKLEATNENSPPDVPIDIAS